MSFEENVARVIERQTDRFYGKYRGLVAINVDPLGQGRLKAIVPEVLGVVPSSWALPCTPYAGTLAGLFTVPMVGTGVWIEFEAGDVTRPVWTGCWWGSAQVPLNEARRAVDIRQQGAAHRHRADARVQRHHPDDHADRHGRAQRHPHGVRPYPDERQRPW